MLGLLYLLINNTSPETGDKLHREGYTDGIRKYKLYTHNLLPVNAAYRPDGMVSINNEWEYWFSTADPLLLAIVEHAASLLNTLTLDNITFKIRKIKRMPLRNNGGIYRCVAPIIIKNKEGKYITPAEPEFTDAVIISLNNRFKIWTGREIGDMTFKFLNPRQRLIQFRASKLLSFSGELLLDGHPDIIRFAQLVGLGQKTGIGMGCIA
jgi:CRISPR-associated endoribonuclease Cas6